MSTDPDGPSTDGLYRRWLGPENTWKRATKGGECLVREREQEGLSLGN